MTIIRKIALGGVALAMSAGAVFADGHLEGAVKARKGLMQLYGHNLGILGAMAKGEMEYNAETASAAAGNLMAYVQTNQGSLWPQGSDAGSMEGTRALAKMWETFPAVLENSKAMASSSVAMNAAAGNGLDALRGAIGDVGKACKGCHEAYRAPKK